MIVLSYGFQQPENNDPGSVWFPALNTNIQKLNDHNHDGSNSAPIDASVLVGAEIDILAAAWVLDVTGRYEQTVTMPGSYSFDDFNPVFRLATSGDIVYPSIERISGTQFRIFTLDNTLAYRVVFR